MTTCDRSAVCIATGGMHLSGCRSQMSHAALDAQEAETLPPHQVRVRVREVIEWELLVDTTAPEWSWLAETTENQDEWVAALDDRASETEGPVERAVRAPEASPTGAWREVEFA